MDKEKLDQLLFEETPNELKYKEHENSISNKFRRTATEEINGENVYLIDTLALRSKPVFIRKDSRYSTMPAHTYNSININYIYSGQCTYMVNHTQFILKKGDVCIFDTGVIRSKCSHNYEDIVMNITMTNHYFINSMNHLGGKQNLMTGFVLNAIAENANHDNYIIFRTNQNNKINQLFQQMLESYFEITPYSNEIVQSYLSIIIMELLCLYLEDKSKHIVQFSNKTTNTLFGILCYIENNCECCTLGDLSNVFGYHEKYISNLLKKNYNKTFKQIQTENRIAKAGNLLVNSDLTIDEISNMVGMSNRTQFYHYFKNLKGCLPSEYRIQNKSVLKNI